MRRVPVGSLVPAALIVAALVACSDHTVSGPEAVPAASTSAAAQRGGPPTRPNSVKYSNKGQQPVTGRSGGAQLSSRALLGRDGHVLLELTTADFESAATPTGAITHLQIKHLIDERAAWTRNESNLRATTLERSFHDLKRGDRLQVQANIRTSTGRTGVVTLQDRVWLRPDLQVLELQHASNAHMGTSVPITAVVAETNGDMGARASCVLRINGREADRMDAIWVDAGDHVSCAFQAVFSESGRHEIAVSVEGTRPADFDPRNNTATGEIEINGGSELQYYASAYSYTEYSRHLLIESVSRHLDDSFGGVWRFEHSNEGPHQSVYSHLSGPGRLQFPLQGADFGITTGALSLVSLSGTDLNSTTSFEYTDQEGNNFDSECFMYYDFSTGALVAIYACGQRFTWTNGETTERTVVSYQRGAGTVTYWSNYYQRNWNTETGQDDTYTENSSGSYSYLPMVTYGSDVHFTAHIKDAVGRKISNSRVVMLSPDDQDRSEKQCTDSSFPGVENIFCITETLYSRGVRGLATNF